MTECFKVVFLSQNIFNIMKWEHNQNCHTSLICDRFRYDEEKEYVDFSWTNNLALFVSGLYVLT